MMMFWGVLTSAVARFIPGLGPKVTLWLTSAVLVVLLLAAVFVAGVFYGSGGKKEALAALNLKWENQLREKIDAQNAETQQRVDAALAAAEEIRRQDSELVAREQSPQNPIPPAQKADAPGGGRAVQPDIDRLCERSAACRDRVARGGRR